MSDFRVQHFVPCSYLKFFSVDGDWSKGRKTRIYFTDGKKCILVPVNDLAREEYTYSRETPEFDKIFNSSETDYPLIISKAIKTGHLSNSERLRLLHISWILHLRNISYLNKTGNERKDLLALIDRSFMQSIFGDLHSSNIKSKANHLTRTWNTRFLRPLSNEKLITSDNPSVIFSHPNTSTPILTLLPISPTLLFVGYKSSCVSITSNHIDDKTIAVLNGIQGLNCNKHLYSDESLLDNEEEAKSLLNVINRPRPTGYVDNEKWQTNYYHFDSNAIRDMNFLSKVNSKLRNTIKSIINKSK